MNKPLISVITPTYNHEKYISECIESVLNQTYENWEMIIVDDCSKDSTYEIAKEYVNRDKRIKLIKHPENYGALNLDKTYNEALSMSRGEWISILEGDDVWPIYKLERQIKVLETLSEDVILLHGIAGYIYEDNKAISFPRIITPLNLPRLIPYNAFDYLIYGINPIFSQTVLIKKESLLKIGGFIQIPKDIRLVDFPTWLRLLRIGKFVYDSYVLGFWRRHENSITMNYQDIIAIKYREAIKEFLKEIEIKEVDNNCIGILSYLGAIRLTILKKDFKTAKYFIDEIEKCLRLGKLQIDYSTKLKLFIYKLLINFRQYHLLSIMYKAKKNFIDNIFYNYKPFFFKDEIFIKKLENYNLSLVKDI